MILPENCFRTQFVHRDHVIILPRPFEEVFFSYPGSQHDGSVLLENSLLLLLESRDSEPVDVQPSLWRSEEPEDEDAHTHRGSFRCILNMYSQNTLDGIKL